MDAALSTEQIEQFLKQSTYRAWSYLLRSLIFAGCGEQFSIPAGPAVDI